MKCLLCSEPVTVGESMIVGVKLTPSLTKPCAAHESCVVFHFEQSMVPGMTMMNHPAPGVQIRCVLIRKIATGSWLVREAASSWITDPVSWVADTRKLSFETPGCMTVWQDGGAQ